MNQQKVDAIAALLADTSDPVTSVDIAFVAQQEERRKVFKAELANAPPHPIPNDEEWATYKAFCSTAWATRTGSEPTAWL